MIPRSRVYVLLFTLESIGNGGRDLKFIIPARLEISKEFRLPNFFPIKNANTISVLGR